MQDVLDIIKNIESIYDSNTSFGVLKDFERVIDELDLYVYKNWAEGELAEGPIIERHWVTCTFMWPEANMPDPMGAKRLLDYDCKVGYKRSTLITPRKIKKPDDIRPGSKKGKLDESSIWLVKIQMPKKLISDIYSGYIDEINKEPVDELKIPSQAQSADELSAEGMDAGVGGEGGGDVGLEGGL